MSPAPFAHLAVSPWGLSQRCRNAFGCAWPHGYLLLEPHGARRPQGWDGARAQCPQALCEEDRSPLPAAVHGDAGWEQGTVAGRGRAASSCPSGPAQLPHGDTHWVPPCPGALHCPQHLPGQRPVPRPRGGEGTPRPVPLRAQGPECDVALRVQAQPLAALGPRHQVPAATTILRQRPLQRPPVVHVPGAADRRVLVPRAR